MLLNLSNRLYFCCICSVDSQSVFCQIEEVLCRIVKLQLLGMYIDCIKNDADQIKQKNLFCFLRKTLV